MSASQEKLIYRSLATQIQLGFFDDGERFPSAQEIAMRHRVSYCPAQRALKALEKDGLIKLCRGRQTTILSKPYENYLASPLFTERLTALADLNKSLEMISPSLCSQAIAHIDLNQLSDPPDVEHPMKWLHWFLSRSLQELGSRTVMSLYYDIGEFVESAYADILYTEYGDFNQLVSYCAQLWHSLQHMDRITAVQCMETIGKHFFLSMDMYFQSAVNSIGDTTQRPFIWEPHKGRTRYCDTIAIDLVCKIKQGMYPIGTLLPGSAVLADIYHVSEITIRRTIALLNRLGIAKNMNGIGTRIVSSGTETNLIHLRELMLDENLRTCLEALQLVAITCERVVQCTFPYLTGESLADLHQSICLKDPLAAVVSTISASLQAITRCCPLKMVREIYEKSTLLLLNGSILRLDKIYCCLIPNWPAFSQELLQSLEKNDAASFAQSLRRLFVANFVQLKQALVNARITEADDVKQPLSI